MTRFAAVAATATAAGMALSICCCGGEELWSFAYVDASNPSTSAAGMEASGGGAAQDAHTKDASAAAEDGSAGLGCPTGTFGCIPCNDNGDCLGHSSFPQCGSEKRCVQCTTDDACASDPDSGPRFICFDEHCVIACGDHKDCLAQSLGFGCSTAANYDAGFCFECNAAQPNANSCGTCNFDGICVDCTGQACGGGTCSANGYCTGPSPAISSRDL